MRQIVTDFVGPKRFRTWSKENELWWVLWRTVDPGSFGVPDKKTFEACKAKYLIYLDHSHDQRAREMALHILDRCSFFMGAKVSKFARDGEKVLVMIGRDERYHDSIARYAKLHGMLLFGVKPAGEGTPHEIQAQATWGLYLKQLARAYAPIDEPM